MDCTFLCLGSFGSWASILSCESFSCDDPLYLDHEFDLFVDDASKLKVDVLIIRIDHYCDNSSTFSSVARVDDKGVVTRL